MARKLGTRPLLAIVSALVLGLAMVPAGAEPAPAGERTDRGPDGYIVVLDHGDPDRVAKEHRRDHDAEVRHVYRHALQGYAARMSERAAERVAEDDRVAYVEADREITIAHHQCGHLGGPGDGGDECDVHGAVTSEDADIDGATVVIEETGQDATTDEEGDYRIADVEDGEYTLTADAEGYEPASKEIVVDNDDVEVDFALKSEAEPEAGTISGTVTDTGDEAIADATVAFDETDDETTTGTDGGYTIEDVDAGEYTVTVSHDDYGSDSQTVEVDGDVTGVDFVLRAHGSISGTVTDTGDEAIADATVAFDETDDETTTGTDGGYTIEDVDAGEYTVTVSHDDYGSDSRTVEVDGDVDGVDFELAEPTHEHEADNVPWGVERTGAAELHGEYTGDGVSVYVIDSGIDATHDDLEPNLGEGHAVVECHKTRGETCDALWDDDHGHGTHVAGTAAATDAHQVVGVAPDATLHAVKVLDRRARGWSSDVIAGVEWVAEQAKKSEEQAVVANMSLGRSGSKGATCTDDGLKGNGDSYHEAICGATNAGAVFAVAAGNSDADAEGTVPAAYHDTVLTVSAIQQDEEAEGEVFAEFSNWGDDLFDWADNEKEPQSAPVALAAPGVDVLSTWNDGRLHVGSGTSMAAPHVAGAAALQIGADGDIPGDGRQAFLDVRAALMDGAESTYNWEDDSSFEDEVDDPEQRQEGFLDLRFLE